MRLRVNVLQVMFCDKVAKVMFASQMMLFALLTVMFCAAHKVNESGKPRNATFPLNNFMVQSIIRNYVYWFFYLCSASLRPTL